MDEILEKYPEFENRLYIIGGPLYGCDSAMEANLQF